MKRLKILFSIFGLLTLIVNILIIVESFIGEANSASQSISFTESVIEIIETINPSIQVDHQELHAVIRKLVGHFLLFGLSGTLTSISLFFTYESKNNKRYLLLISLVSGLLLATVSELIQYFVPGRYGLLTDILIDFAGFTTFTLICFGIYLIVISSKKKKEQN